jgi:hypothetical protein
MLKKKKHAELSKKRVVPKARDKRLVLMQARICDSSLTHKQRQMILHEVGKWRG